MDAEKIIECMWKSFNTHQQIEKYLEDLENLKLDIKYLKLKEDKYKDLIKDMIGDGEVCSNVWDLILSGNETEAVLYLKNILN